MKMSDRLLKESDVIEAFKGRESLIHDVYTATAIIRSVPSADRPHGEWIHDYHFGLALPEHKCSVCGEWEYSDTESNFCPNCGARMKGVGNE